MQFFSFLNGPAYPKLKILAATKKSFGSVFGQSQFNQLTLSGLK
jgi:hypothetical protein